MDRLKVQEWLKEKIGEDVSYHPEFVNEFSELVGQSGLESKILKQLLRRYLTMKNLEVDSGLNWLEKLKHTDGLYSLHVDVAKTNYRILFSRDGEGRIFLHMFYEQSGHRNTSYEAHIPIALKRREEMTQRRP